MQKRKGLKCVKPHLKEGKGLVISEGQVNKKETDHGERG